MKTLRHSLFYFLVLSFACVTAYLADHYQWADSELWSLGSARQLAFGPGGLGLDKVAFMAVLRCLYFFDLGNLETISTARFLFAGVGVAVGVLLAAVARADRGDGARSAWTAFIFLSTGYFLSQGFRIRADLMATAFQLLAVWCFLRGYGSGVLIAHAFLFLCTPKAIYFFAVNLVFMVFSGSSRRSILLNCAVPLSLLAAGAAIRPRMFTDALDYFGASFGEGNGHPGFLSAESLRYVFAFPRENPLTLLLLPFAWFARRRPDQQSTRALGAAACAAIALIFLHNDPLPFFILAMLPFPILWLGARTSHFWSHRSARIVLGLTIVALAVPSTLDQARKLERGGNDVQRATVALLEGYLKSHPAAIFYDGVVTLPRSAFFYTLPAPDHPGNREEVLSVFHRKDLELVFFSNRMHFYTRELYGVLQERFFIQVGRGVFARAKVYGVSKKMSFQADQLTEICRELAAYGELRLYEGEDFLAMRVVPRDRFHWDCFTENESPPEVTILSEAPFLAFSRFASLELPEGRSFARIFDNDTGN